ncbi:MAG: lipocalin family protein [Thermoanaerobaculia bacterium]
MRLRDGTVEPLSHGSLVAADGSSRFLGLDDVELEVLRTWRSSAGTEYPAGWRLRFPASDLDLIVEPLLADQELDAAFRYWEGAVSVRGTDGGDPVAGLGYVELVGYAPRPGLTLG